MTNPVLLNSLRHTRQYFAGKEITTQAIDDEIEKLVIPEQNRAIGHDVMDARHDWDSSTPYTEVGAKVREIVDKHTPAPESEDQARIRYFADRSFDDLPDNFLYLENDEDWTYKEGGNYYRVGIYSGRMDKLHQHNGVGSMAFPLVGFPVTL